MKLKAVAVAAALAGMAASASAGFVGATAPISFPAGSVSFTDLAASGNHVVVAPSSFGEGWTFTTDETLWDVSFSITSSYAGYQSLRFIDNLTGTISGGSIVGSVAMSGPDYSCTTAGCRGFQHLDANFASLDAGTYSLRVVGTNIGSPSSYGVSVVGAIPEPETYALLLAGLASVGFVVSRRRKE